MTPRPEAAPPVPDLSACHDTGQRIKAAREFTVPVAGNPDVGKTTLINALAGTNLRVGNWSGVTVEKREASPPGVVEGVLRTLLAGGYVQPAAPGTGACGCGGCSLKSLCRAADQPGPALPLLRLTPRGEARLKAEAGFSGHSAFPR